MSVPPWPFAFKARLYLFTLYPLPLDPCWGAPNGQVCARKDFSGAGVALVKFVLSAAGNNLADGALQP